MNRIVDYVVIAGLVARLAVWFAGTLLLLPLLLVVRERRVEQMSTRWARLLALPTAYPDEDGREPLRRLLEERRATF